MLFRSALCDAQAGSQDLNFSRERFKVKITFSPAYLVYALRHYWQAEPNRALRIRQCTGGDGPHARFVQIEEPETSQVSSIQHILGGA